MPAPKRGDRGEPRSAGTDLPVLVVTGAGLAAAAVRLRTVPVLAERFRVLTAPARSVAGDAAGAVARFADEAVEVLDRAGERRAWVYGLSFGGLVAQEIALRHPERVAALVLAATSAGGTLCVDPDSSAVEFIERRATMPAEEGVWASIPYSYALVTRRRHADRIGRDILKRLEDPPDPRRHRMWRAAAAAHDAAGRLTSIDVPTLVLHGEEDRMVPPENGRGLAGHIAGARLVLLPGAAHVLPTDEPGADREAVRFLLEQQQAGQAAGTLR